MLLGVCGGVAQRWDLDPTLVRLAFVALCFFGPGLLVYLIAAIVIPRAPELPVGESYRVLQSSRPPVDTIATVREPDRSRDPMHYGY